MQEVQEEGKYAIDSPGSPTATDIPPEEYDLGKICNYIHKLGETLCCFTCQPTATLLSTTFYLCLALGLKINVYLFSPYVSNTIS